MNHSGKHHRATGDGLQVSLVILLLLLLLLLSHFSRVRLCATPETAAQQAAPSLGFSRQEHWSGMPLPSPSLVKSCSNSQALG